MTQLAQWIGFAVLGFFLLISIVIVVCVLIERFAYMMARLEDWHWQRKSRAQAKSTVAPRCGVPLIGGGFCMEPASDGCAYCELHAAWPKERKESFR